MKDIRNPAHYRAHPSGVKEIEISEHFSFCLGNAISYIWRAGLKGDAIDDLNKARWHIDREIQRLELARLERQEDEPIPYSLSIARDSEDEKTDPDAKGPGFSLGRCWWVNADASSVAVGEHENDRPTGWLFSINRGELVCFKKIAGWYPASDLQIIGELTRNPVIWRAFFGI